MESSISVGPPGVMVALGNGDGTFAKPIMVLSAGIMNQSAVGFRFSLLVILMRIIDLMLLSMSPRP